MLHTMNGSRAKGPRRTNRSRRFDCDLDNVWLGAKDNSDHLTTSHSGRYDCDIEEDFVVCSQVDQAKELGVGPFI